MVEDEISAELDKLGVTSVAPGRAAVALKLARALDQLEAGDAPTSQAVVADKLDTIMAKLRALAPVQAEEGDAVNDITAQREKRQAEARKQAAGD
ncbi:hypothetical protein EDD93_3680 [Streptomyces sp. 840.1]|uniref:hypothetical protein n=1 Tax=Streptomyces sp. 840.1 TaxID=2485152 RepID=UPI000F4ACD19|nr:hypothetical protein [Streptomyces sp. 840.1]ROQ69183.1 hypothetical protein EDD93_3680 [Streptomyces sp. 840.1]